MSIGTLGDYVADQTSGVLRDAASMIRQGDTEFIRDGDPQSVPGKIVQGAARAACRAYADDPTSVRAAVRPKAEKSCRPYLEDIGYGIPPTAKKPFPGGQCATNYRIWAEQYNAVFGRWNDSAALGGGAQQIRGPVLSLALTNGGPCQGGLGPGFLLGAVATGGANGDSVLTIPQACITSPPSGEPGLRALRLVRSDGQPDNCGNPPPVYTGPIPPVAPAPRPEPFSPSPDIDIDIGVDINADGTINVDIGTGPITIDPWGDDDGAAGLSTDPVPTDPGAAGASESTGIGGEAGGEAPEGQELVGLLITVTSAPAKANTFGRTQQTVYRGVGYVRMGYPNRLGLDVSGGAVISPQFFHAQQRGLTSHKVGANLGYDLTVTPFYRDINP